MLRRTTTSSSQIENVLRWFFFAALAAAAISALAVPPYPLSPLLIFLILVVASIKPVLAVLPYRVLPENRTILTLLDLAIVVTLYFLTGASRGVGALLLLPFSALAATRLSLEDALVAAAAASLAFSIDLLIPGSSPVVSTNLIAFGVFLAITFLVVLIVHFAITGQREAEARRRTQTALEESRRLIEQEEMLVRLSRDITGTASLQQMVDVVLETANRFIPFTGGSVSLVDGHNRLFVVASRPPTDAPVNEIRLPVGQGIAGWVAEKQQAFYSPDIDAETRVTPAFRAVGTNARLKSFLGVPLLARGKCIGVLEVDSTDSNAFTPEHLRLLEALAAQVGGAIANARLFEERQLFSQQLEAVYNAANELTGHFDMDLVLQEFVRHASSLIQTRHAAAVVLDDEGRVDRFATVGFAAEQRASIKTMSSSTGLLADIFKQSRPVRREISSDGLAAGLPAGHPKVATLLAIPLVARGETQGAIYLADRVDGLPFTSEDEELLRILAAGASAAISNARLYSQLRRNIEQLYALHQIGQAIGSSLEPEDVLRVFDHDVKHLCAAEAAVVSAWNSFNTELSLMSREGPQDLLAARELPENKARVETAAKSNEGSSLVVDLDDGRGKMYGYVAPLNVRGRQVGLAEIYSHDPAVISAESSSIFMTLAAQLAVSIENASLYTQLQRREVQLRNFVGRLFQAEDGERRRLAYDVHDGLAQLIVSADMHLSNFASLRGEEPEQANRQLEKGLERLKAALTEVRRVVSELRPSTLDDFGLVNTLRRYVEQLAREEGWDYVFEENLGDLRLDPAIETGAYRIVQESLNNIRKYSFTPRVEIYLNQDGEYINIHVQDWGRGFVLEEARQREGHFGLSSMEERARLLGGSFEIDSRPGQGTQIDVRLPCYRAVPAVKA